MLQFEFDVEATKLLAPAVEGFLFQPSRLKLRTYPKEIVHDAQGQPQEVVRVVATLTQTLPPAAPGLPPGFVQQERYHFLSPASLQLALTGDYDIDLQKPVINETGLNQILSAFQLRLKQ